MSREHILATALALLSGPVNMKTLRLHSTMDSAAPVYKGADVVLVDFLAVAAGEEGIQVAARAPVHILLQQHR